MAKVLVVDDSAFMRKMMKDIVTDLGISDIVEADTGEMAVDKFEQETPDVVLLDLILPSMNGDKVLEQILGIDNTAKVIMATAVGQEDVMEKCLDTGAKSYIVKPFDKEKVEAELKKYLYYLL